MEHVALFKKGERVMLEYEIEGRFLKDDTIYYTLKNPANGTYLKDCAFTGDELIPIPSKEAQDGDISGS